MVKNGYKYFISYKNNYKSVQLCMMLPKIIGYTKNLMELSIFLY